MYDLNTRFVPALKNNKKTYKINDLNNADTHKSQQISNIYHDLQVFIMVI